MSDEICEVFGEVLGLCTEDIKNDRMFPFVYLQRAGAGSRTLCIPAVKDSFQWNGRQVASLAKSGQCNLLAGGGRYSWMEKNGTFSSRCHGVLFFVPAC